MLTKIETKVLTYLVRKAEEEKTFPHICISSKNLGASIAQQESDTMKLLRRLINKNAIVRFKKANQRDVPKYKILRGIQTVNATTRQKVEELI